MHEWSWANVGDAEALGLAIIGRGVKRGRLALRVTQQQLALRIGVTQSTISRLDTGRIRSMRVRTLAKVVGVLALSPDFLFARYPPGPSRRLPGQA